MSRPWCIAGQTATLYNAGGFYFLPPFDIKPVGYVRYSIIYTSQEWPGFLLYRCWRWRIIIFQIFISLCGWKHLEMCVINFSRMSRNWNIVVSNLNHSLFTYLPLQYVLLSSFLNRWLKLRTISISVEHSPEFGGQYFLIGLFFFLFHSVETLSACCFLSLPALFGVHDSAPKQPPVFSFHVRSKV